jgi:hypothetical protein
MRNAPFMTTAYARTSPMADMFVPHRVAVSLPMRRRTYRASTVAAALLAIIAVPALLTGSSTGAYFSDLEQSTGDTFAAGPLDFTVSVVPPGATLVLGQAGETFTLTVTPIAGSLPFRYKVSAVTSGDAAFCSAITASGAAPLAYNGSASALATGDTNDLTPWSLTLTLPSPSPSVVDGMKCNLDLTYQGYQEGGAVETEYHDTEHVVLNLVADPPQLPPPPPASSTTPPPPAEDLIITPDAPIVDATTTDTTAGDTGTTTDETVVEPPPDPPPADTPPTDPPPDSPIE